MSEFPNKKLTGEQKGISRRRFVQIAGISALGITSLGNFNFKSKGVSIVISNSDETANSKPCTMGSKRT